MQRHGIVDHQIVRNDVGANDTVPRLAVAACNQVGLVHLHLGCVLEVHLDELTNDAEDHEADHECRPSAEPTIEDVADAQEDQHHQREVHAAAQRLAGLLMLSDLALVGQDFQGGVGSSESVPATTLWPSL